MILSHSRKFIFIKTRKTAGTSVEIGLSKFCKSEDVITPITSNDEEIRKAHGGMGPLNYRKKLRDYDKKDVADVLLKRRWPRAFWNHMPASQVRTACDNVDWDSYFKFCFERNPWDKCVSLYYWRSKNGAMPQALNEFILEENGFFDRWVKRENEMYMVDGEVIVDKVYMFENLDSALGDIAKKLGINSEFNLPKAKQGHRKQGQAAGEKLSQASKEKIEACFSWQIKAFDYKPRDTV